MATAVYIGTGTDVLRPIKALGSTHKRYIYVDPLPRTEFPTVYTDNAIRNHDMVDRVIDKLEAHGFRYDGFEITPEPFVAKFTSSRGDILVDYHFSTAFPSQVDASLARKINGASTLVIAGYHPDKCILDMMNGPVHIATFEDTYYGDEPDEDQPDNVVSYLHTDSSKIASITHFEKSYVGTSFSKLIDVENYRVSKA